MSKKSNLKSVRISDEVMAYVLAFPGTGFNQKFENLVLFCMKEETQKRALLSSLDRDIAAECARIGTLRQLERQAARTSYTLTDVEVQLSQLSKLLDSLGTDPQH